MKKKIRPNNLVQYSYRRANATLFPGGTAAEIVNIVKAARKAKEVEAARREMMKRLLKVFFEICIFEGVAEKYFKVSKYIQCFKEI